MPDPIVSLNEESLRADLGELVRSVFDSLRLAGSGAVIFRE